MIRIGVSGVVDAHCRGRLASEIRRGQRQPGARAQGHCLPADLRRERESTTPTACPPERDGQARIAQVHAQRARELAARVGAKAMVKRKSLFGGTFAGSRRVPKAEMPAPVIVTDLIVPGARTRIQKYERGGGRAVHSGCRKHDRHAAAEGHLVAVRIQDVTQNEVGLQSRCRSAGKGNWRSVLR